MRGRERTGTEDRGSTHLKRRDTRSSVRDQGVNDTTTSQTPTDTSQGHEHTHNDIWTVEKSIEEQEKDPVCSPIRAWVRDPDDPTMGYPKYLNFLRKIICYMMMSSKYVDIKCIKEELDGQK